MAADYTIAGHMVIRPEPRGLWATRRVVRDIAEDLGFGEDDVVDLTIAVGEALSNAYAHGTPDPRNNFIYVDWEYSGRTLSISIKDDGAGLRRSRSRSRVHSIPRIVSGGRGIGLMTTSADEVQLNLDGEGTVVLKKRLPFHRQAMRPAACGGRILKPPGRLTARPVRAVLQRLISGD